MLLFWLNWRSSFSLINLARWFRLSHQGRRVFWWVNNGKVSMISLDDKYLLLLLLFSCLHEQLDYVNWS